LSQDTSLDGHRLFLQLTPVIAGELYLATRLNYPAFIYENIGFKEVIPAGEVPSREIIAQLIRGQVKEVFLHPKDAEVIKANLQQALVKTTRSLSIGDPAENGAKQVKLLLLNLVSLYRNPHDDELLMLHYQSGQNLSKFFLENKKLHSQFFQNTVKESFHFTILQPMLSSMLLASFLQSIRLFHDKEIESLFLTSYLKDVGIGLIPEEKYDVKNLTIDERQLFAQHADFSHELLDGRVPLSKNHLSIIKHHHFLNSRLKRILSKEKWKPNPEMVFGLESTLVGLSDIIIAMISGRPYRQPLTLYQSLEIIRKMIGEEYPQEFKALVIFLRQFFK
jgi:HD-GYP domain-containing protein (c-di-GMP phosphodiesterase class II)